MATSTFTELRRGLGSCAACHQAPAQTGGFSYLDAHRGSQVLINGQYRNLPGIADVAPRMAEALVEGWMPPASIRQGDEAGYADLGKRLEAWIAAGSPELGSFPLSGEATDAGQQLAPEIAAAMTDLGDCIPVPEIVGTDAPRDATFARATALPDRLTDTDLVSRDAYELAQRGTVGYDVEYPLWADNAHKGRWVHVPSTRDAGGTARPVPIRYDAATEHFVIPANTRFYKTFFKAVSEADGATRYRKVETPPGTARTVTTRRAIHRASNRCSSSTSRPGNVFNFTTALASIYAGTGTYITSTGAVNNSLIYRRMATATTMQGTSPLLHMPLHTPGIDCGAVDMVGKWITSIPNTASALAAADAFVSDCKLQPDIDWLESFTKPRVYAPSRGLERTSDRHPRAAACAGVRERCRRWRARPARTLCSSVRHAASPPSPSARGTRRGFRANGAPKSPSRVSTTPAPRSRRRPVSRPGAWRTANPAWPRPSPR